jgi:UDP-GlcNAc:undecaprenyl-phosphate/decaprenyl-phosphate GlcNAc-1-phosphate transferase
MATYMLIFASALVFAVGATPVMRRLAPHLGLIDQPGARKVHTNPVPLMGGVGLYAAIIAALLIFGDRFNVAQLVSILVGGTWVSFLGVCDDRWGLSPMLKLGGQIVAALILIVSGVGVTAFGLPAVNTLVTLVWVVGITNALNLLDNMDGLSGGVAATAAAYFLVMAALSGQYLVAALSAALLGACLGFLAYNFNPASIFMGDTGSLFLGFLLAALGIKLRFPANSAMVTWMVPVMTLGVLILDTSLVTISRLRRGLNPLTTPGKDHLSHRLVAAGYSQREAVLMLYIVAEAFGLLALLLTRASVREGYIFGATVLLVCLFAIWRFEWGMKGSTQTADSTVELAPAAQSCNLRRHDD